MGAGNPVIVEKSSDIRSLVLKARAAGETVALVPTMGALHAGHLSLVEVAREQATRIAVSIFVNPLQFNSAEDLENYPGDFEHDEAVLKEAGVDFIYRPDPGSFYRPGFKSGVIVDGLTAGLEGRFRPGHFRAVTTVVAMLFHSVEPDIAVFGEKDFQQLRCIEQMAADLRFPVQIVRGKLIREGDGLALSSRNVRLDEQGRRRALSLSAGLFSALAIFRDGERSAEVLAGCVRTQIGQEQGVEIEYVEVVDEEDLQPVDQIGAAPCRIMVAARVGAVRLIDNIELTTG